jgi:hypothetical protein
MKKSQLLLAQYLNLFEYKWLNLCSNLGKNLASLMLKWSEDKLLF